MITIKKFNDLSTIELYKILQVRNEVFIVEQECVYQDIDDKDLDAYHCFTMDQSNTIISYVRILKAGVSYKHSPSIGRVLVTPNNRRKGYSSRMMKFAIEFIFTTFKEDIIIISAQEYLISFYTSLGFKQVGDVYLEDNIPHLKMVLTKSKYCSK